MNVLEKIKDDLLLVQNPARYTGGEFHYGQKDMEPVNFYTAICFPDLYEIGMSNNAVRILYDVLNRIPTVHCDRVFSVGEDFEQLLREKQLPLYTLDLGMPLHELDLLNISIGYELCATNILQVLELGGLSLHTEDRKETDPVVICGGPAATNPLPFSRFIDFTLIGEGEHGMVEITRKLQEGKAKGYTRSQQIEALKQFDYLWYPGKELATRIFDHGFATAGEDHRYVHYVVPNFKVTQDNGVVEIMRGCPNGCRFCHAGQFYKPYRQKQYSTIKAQVDQNIYDFGFREITLSSLSSGDHAYIKELIDMLNAEYSAEHVSFSLPSLKVSSFSLDILEKLSKVRKSGLTFAIETPLPEWQRAINKDVPVERVIEIAREAKRRGWKLAKFYFMVGLPFIDREVENEAIVEYLAKVHDATHINMNINIGTFIPKPHTPFQWARQLRPEESYTQLSSLKRAIQERIRGCKVSYHEPNISYVEGLISRGDMRYADVIEQAYRKGCRLDAWDEYFKPEKWEEAIKEASYDPEQAIFEPATPDDILPWDSVSMGVRKQFLKAEYEHARESILLKRCSPECSHPCGVCNSENKVTDTTDVDPVLKAVREGTLVPEAKVAPIRKPVQVIMTYRRSGRALYVSHINAMRNFEMSFQRSGLLLQFTQGYNPKPKLEFVNPLSLGIAGENEVLLADIEFEQEPDPGTIKQLLSEALPQGYVLKDVLVLPTGKKQTLAKYIKGSIYSIDTRGNEEYGAVLDGWVGKEDEKLSVIRKGEGRYEVRVEGEQNMVKRVFGPDADKFDVASKLSIVRTGLCAGSWEQDYIGFFSAKMAQAV
jgi:radical SAM-linked protein